MMLLDSAPPPSMSVRAADVLIRRRPPTWPSADVSLARMLFAIWAARTGRVLRAVPVTELTEEELLEFWTDDQLEPIFATAEHRRPS
jgi:hypothetical protein